MPENRSLFPRGLVLGLTMAETAVLIIFVLLLAMTVLLTGERSQRQIAQQQLEQYEEIQQILSKHGIEIDELISRSRDRSAADNWRELVRELEVQRPTISPEGLVSRLNEAQELQDVLTDEMGDDSNVDRLQGIRNLTRDAKRWRAQSGGRGTDHPSCWYDADGSVAYLFDVALTDDGFVIQAAHAPEHVQDRASLPIEGVVTSQTLTADQFLAQTHRIFEWSAGNECRFFVRAFDLTAADQKELYKARMRTLESRFYKNASPSGPVPFLDSASSRP